MLRIYVAFYYLSLFGKASNTSLTGIYATDDTDDRHSDKFLIPSSRSTKGWLYAYSSDNGWPLDRQRARCQVHRGLRPSHVLSPLLNVSSKSSVKLLFRLALKRIYIQREANQAYEIHREKKKGKVLSNARVLITQEDADRLQQEELLTLFQTDKPLYYFVMRNQLLMELLGG